MIGFTFTADTEWPAEVTHVRLWDLGVAWQDIHVAPQVFNWARLDRLVDMAGGRHVTYVIGATPRWLAKDPDSQHAAPWLGPGSNSMPWSMSHAGEFIGALAERYAGRINAYEVWNEPQLADFLYPWSKSSRNALAALTGVARNEIHAADPTALVLAASVLPRPSSGGMKRASLYLDALKDHGWPVDGFTCHIYPEAGQGVDRWAWMLTQARNALTRSGAPTRRLWVTETTFGLLGDDIAESAAPDLVRGVYAAAGHSAVWWYGWNRPDLHGLALNPGSAAWRQIQASGK